MKKIYKYPTGAEVPEGATYLGTVTQTKINDEKDHPGRGMWCDCWLVWHYFLVEVEEDNK